VKLYAVGQVDFFDDNADDLGTDGFGRSKLRYHKSEKILGRLYRAVDEKNIWAENVRINSVMDGSSVWSAFYNFVRSRLEGLKVAVAYKHRLEEAQKLREL
jgi:hypothetical protein